MEALAEKLTPKRRPQDRAAPECSLQELRALAAIAKQGTLTMSELAAVLGVQLSTATHTVGKLADKGLVDRRRQDPDRRVVRVGFGKRGVRINRWVVKAREAEGRALLSALRPPERTMLIAALAKMVKRRR
jgi:DNA-binding MarR family transcriptional regulator